MTRRAAGPSAGGLVAPETGVWQVEVRDGDARLPSGFADLVAACTRADDHPPFGEHTLLTLDGHRQVRHARLACHDDGRLVGYAVLAEALDAWYLEVAVTPAVRGQGAGSALVRAAAGHVASHGGGVLRAWAHAAGPAAERLAAGWRPVRDLHVLERTLAGPPEAPAVPDGLGLRTLDATDARDRDAWLTLSNAAFAGHPENGGWTRADLDWRMDAAWTDPALFPVLHDDGGLVAGVWTKTDGSGTGELYVVAVHPCRQGRGLGAVVVAEALRRLALAGLDRAVLYVDVDNRPAGRLYAAHGFVRHHTDRCYDLTVPAAPGPDQVPVTPIGAAPVAGAPDPSGGRPGP